MINIANKEFPETDEEWAMAELDDGLVTVAHNVATGFQFFYMAPFFSTEFSQEKELFDKWINTNIVVKLRLTRFIKRIEPGPDDFANEGFVFQSGVTHYTVFEDDNWNNKSWTFYALQHAWRETCID
jgi:hypothetical protein